jgi:hypothetical protein
LIEAHLAEQRIEVVLRRRRAHAHPRACRSVAEPAVDARLQSGAPGRQPDRRLVREPLDRDLVERLERERSSTPRRCGAAALPRRTPSQISRSAFFSRSTRVERPSLATSSHAPGSSKPVR